MVPLSGSTEVRAAVNLLTPTRLESTRRPKIHTYSGYSLT